MQIAMHAVRMDRQTIQSHEVTLTWSVARPFVTPTGVLYGLSKAAKIRNVFFYVKSTHETGHDERVNRR